MGCTGNLVAIFAEAVTEPLDRRSPDRPSPDDRKDARGHPGWPTHLTGHGELQRSADCPRRGRYGTDAIKSMWPLKWRAPRDR
jgi:hypothetical protein